MKIDINKYVPAFLSMIVALCITLAVRLILPNPDNGNVYNQTEELPLPEIPFAAKKENNNADDAFVLITTKNINQWEKISASDVTWKKWPREAISVSFIAKDSKDNMLNDSGTYSAVLNMLAKYPIVKGVPITMSVLARKREVEKETKTSTYNGPSEEQIRANVEKELTAKFRREEHNRKMKEEEERRKQEELERLNRIKEGASIATIQIDQKSAPPAYFVKVGDYVDLKFHSQRDNKSKVFTNLKVLAVNGIREDEPNIESIKNIGNTIVSTVLVEGDEEVISSIVEQLNHTPNAILNVKNQDAARKEVNSKPTKKEIINKKSIDAVITKNIKSTSGVVKTAGGKPKVSNAHEVERIIKMNNLTTPKVNKPAKEKNVLKDTGFLKSLLGDGSKLNVPSFGGNLAEAKNNKNEIRIIKKMTETTESFDENGEKIDSFQDGGKFPIQGRKDSF